MNAAACRCFFAALRKQNPSPSTELLYGNHYQLLVAVVLSAQATDKGVNRATRELFARVKTPTEMLALGGETLTGHIRTIGLFRAKARNILALSEILIQQHNGAVPKTRESLEALPGVGRKTANVVLNTAFGQPTIAVDTHIFRVANRTGMAAGKTPAAVEEQLLKAVPAQYKKKRPPLVNFTRAVCLPGKESVMRRMYYPPLVRVSAKERRIILCGGRGAPFSVW